MTHQLLAENNKSRREAKKTAHTFLTYVFFLLERAFVNSVSDSLTEHKCTYACTKNVKKFRQNFVNKGHFFNTFRIESLCRHYMSNLTSDNYSSKKKETCTKKGIFLHISGVQKVLLEKFVSKSAF